VIEPRARFPFQSIVISQFAQAGAFTSLLHFDNLRHNNAAPVSNPSGDRNPMSDSAQIHFPKHKPQPKREALPSKAAPQVKPLDKAQPSGLSREELRQIVLEMIG
jgi:hypothetical protein